MRRWLSMAAAALAPALLALAAIMPAAGAATGPLTFTSCKGDVNFACAHLDVPLDPSGRVPGTIRLALERHRAPLGGSNSVIIGLAGGPGQAALPFAEQFTEILGAAGARHDEIVFDQRGTGDSHPLACKALAALTGPSGSVRGAVARCAAQLGPTRVFYTTADTVADIEAIRQAGGYEKVILYGTSYGTKVAEDYAAAYPQNVEALVLDSVVPPGGPDAFYRSTFEAIPRVLRSICARHACAHVTSDPVGALRRVLARTPHRGLRIATISDRGRRSHVSVTPPGLLEVLLEGDFSGLLRSQLVTDLSAAARGDEAPLGRLYELASGDEASEEGFQVPLYYATVCEEESLPFNRAASSAMRLDEARAAALALPTSAFAPFSARTALAIGDAPACSDWPYQAGVAPPPVGPLPDVPTLILSGADDLRTPTANARELAAAVPDAKLLVVPYTGHSVLSDGPGSCPATALQAFFAGHAIKPCSHSGPPALLLPPPRPPRAVAALHAVHGYHGSVGRTLRAVQLTLHDYGVQLALELEGLGIEELFSRSSISVPGLRSGWARLDATGIAFHDYSYVPGVTISGTFRSETGELRISGASAAPGELHHAAHHKLAGTLGGVSVRLPESSSASAAIVGSDATASQMLDPRRPGGRRVPGDVAKLVGELLDF